MSPLEAVALVAAIGLPFHLVMLRQLGKLADPAYLRSEGVVILRPEILEACTDEIGRYRGCPIWASVVFMGMTYRFDRAVPRGYRHAIGPGELFLEPGLVYKTD